MLRFYSMSTAMIEKASNNGRYSILDAGFQHSFEDRFQFVLERIGGVGKAAELCHVNRGTIPKWAKSDGKMPLNAALAMVEKAGVTLDWLTTGHHVRPNTEIPGSALSTPPEEALDLARIPLLGVSGAAGAGAANDAAEVEDYYYMPRAQLRALGVPPKFVHFIRVRGDSMEPTIADGAIVLIDASIRRFGGEGIYALSQDGDVRIKRLAKAVEGGFRAISDNPNYPRERLTPDDLYGLRIEGRVRWTERRL
jgi:phage repressor protein C with HTH and peptisase S24 domain